ncbi:MAG: hypothetical protein KAU01_09535 [Candidatus Cloacimonetes bacterium]|nr:hypothetical protein [Candidatus Cloacimonadota bacterium]
MKYLLKLPGNKSNRKVTFTFLAISIISLVIAFIIGIADNPPGLLFCYMGIVALILVFVHRWRKAKNYLILFLASLIGFPVFAVLHNVMYGLEKMAVDIIVLNQLLRFLDVLFFLIALMVCPPGILVGAVGSIVFYFKNKMTK